MSTDYCIEKRKPGGCQLHNLHCGYPACNKDPSAVEKPAAAQPKIVLDDPAYRTFDEFLKVKDGPDIDSTDSARIGWNACAQLYGLPLAEQCTVPPAGWRCTRTAGHDGPCAAVSTERCGERRSAWTGNWSCDRGCRSQHACIVWNAAPPM